MISYKITCLYITVDTGKIKFSKFIGDLYIWVFNVVKGQVTGYLLKSKNIIMNIGNYLIEVLYNGLNFEFLISLFSPQKQLYFCCDLYLMQNTCINYTLYLSLILKFCTVITMASYSILKHNLCSFKWLKLVTVSYISKISNINLFYCL